jgi:hypothetical protein
MRLEFTLPIEMQVSLEMQYTGRQRVFFCFEQVIRILCTEPKLN